MRPVRAILLFLVLATAVLPPPVDAQAGDQAGWDPSRLYVSRAELRDLLFDYQKVLQSDAYSEVLREDARRAADRIRGRLEQGDFRPGDRIVLEIQGVQLPSDTFVVEPGPSILLENMGRISLEGVLRAELNSHLERELSRYIREPVFQATSMIRVQVRGQVARPGFYVVPADMMVGEVLMVAGGPGQEAETDELRILRGDEPVAEGQNLQEAIAEGRSLDQLSVRAGDQIVVNVAVTLKDGSRVEPLVLSDDVTTGSDSRAARDDNDAEGQP